MPVLRIQTLDGHCQRDGADEALPGVEGGRRDARQLGHAVAGHHQYAVTPNFVIARAFRALYENNVFLVATHMMQFAMTGKPAAPMPSRISAWGIYDVFSVKDEEQIFLAVVSDTQWHIFCEAFGFDDLLADARLASNNLRVGQREWMMPILRQRLAKWSGSDIAHKFEQAGLPYAPIKAPHELFEDLHLQATDGLAQMNLPDGREVQTPLLPVMLEGKRLPLRNSPPAVGEDTDALMNELGYSGEDVRALRAANVLG
jgi:crotonobetainyl-CoA:carnitine CoA-transferase CaiB-like acyl-CoA transferase